MAYQPCAGSSLSKALYDSIKTNNNTRDIARKEMQMTHAQIFIRPVPPTQCAQALDCLLIKPCNRQAEPEIRQK